MYAIKISKIQKYTARVQKMAMKLFILDLFTQIKTFSYFLATF